MILALSRLQQLPDSELPRLGHQLLYVLILTGSCEGLAGDAESPASSQPPRLVYALAPEFPKPSSHQNPQRAC